MALQESCLHDVLRVGDRAAQLKQGYAANREAAAIVAFTTLVTGLAMNYVQRGSYLP